MNREDFHDIEAEEGEGSDAEPEQITSKRSSLKDEIEIDDDDMIDDEMKGFFINK